MAHQERPASGASLDQVMPSLEKAAAGLKNVAVILKPSPEAFEEARKAGLHVPQDLIILNNNKTAAQTRVEITGAKIIIGETVVWSISSPLPRIGGHPTMRVELQGLLPKQDSHAIHEWLIQVDRTLKDKSLLLPQLHTENPVLSGYSIPILGLMLAQANVYNMFGITLPNTPYYLLVSYAGAMAVNMGLNEVDMGMINSYDPLSILCYLTAGLYAPALVPNARPRLGRVSQLIGLDNTGASIINKLVTNQRAISVGSTAFLEGIVAYGPEARMAKDLLTAYQKILGRWNFPTGAFAHFLIYHLLKFWLYVRINSIGVLDTDDLSIAWAGLLLPASLEQLVKIVLPSKKDLELFYNIITFPLTPHIMTTYWETVIPNMAIDEQRQLQVATDSLQTVRNQAVTKVPSAAV